MGFQMRIRGVEPVRDLLNRLGAEDLILLYLAGACGRAERTKHKGGFSRGVRGGIITLRDPRCSKRLKDLNV